MLQPLSLCATDNAALNLPKLIGSVPNPVRTVPD